ncbi:hypothetical protein FB451DRAFT_1184785 [Mycena latifolia]|nr:hypothetical protein FB451DRAFT_1184785 [Mycena latifolia]
MENTPVLTGTCNRQSSPQVHTRGQAKREWSEFEGRHEVQFGIQTCLNRKKFTPPKVSTSKPVLLNARRKLGIKLETLEDILGEGPNGRNIPEEMCRVSELRNAGTWKKSFPITLLPLEEFADARAELGAIWDNTLVLLSAEPLRAASAPPGHFAHARASYGASGVGGTLATLLELSSMRAASPGRRRPRESSPHENARYYVARSRNPSRLRRAATEQNGAFRRDDAELRGLRERGPPCRVDDVPPTLRRARRRV